MGTRVTTLVGRARGPMILRTLDDIGTKLLVGRFVKKGVAALAKAIQEGIRVGRITNPMPDETPTGRSQEALAESSSI